MPTKTEPMGLGDVLHRLVENSPAFTPDERVEAHGAITDGNGGDRHYLVPDPDSPDAGRNDPDQAEVDPRDAEIARLRAELSKRDQADQAEYTQDEDEAG